MLGNIIYLIKLMLFKRKWRKFNNNNFTTVGSIFPIDKVTVKTGTYGKINVKLYSTMDPGLSIGNYCSIAEGVKFLLGGEHHYRHLSSYPFKTFMLNETNESVSKGKIIIDDDVWIGYGCTILSGVHIHQGAIIAAGSVVYKDVEPYAIFGNGGIIKYRFNKEIIEELLKVNLSQIKKSDIIQNIELFYTNIENAVDVKNVMKEISENCDLWMR